VPLSSSPPAPPTSAPPCLFYLRGNTHYEGVCMATINGLRAEIHNAAATILDSEWQYGTIAFNSLDISPQFFQNTYTGNMLAVGPGSNVAVRDSILAGLISAPNRVAPVLVDNCQWWQQPNSKAVCPGGGALFSNVTAYPASGPAALWNATV
jgi:hypothetical protein